MLSLIFLFIQAHIQYIQMEQRAFKSRKPTGNMMHSSMIFFVYNQTDNILKRLLLAVIPDTYTDAIKDDGT